MSTYGWEGEKRLGVGQVLVYGGADFVVVNSCRISGDCPKLTYTRAVLARVSYCSRTPRFRFEDRESYTVSAELGHVPSSVVRWGFVEAGGREWDDLFGKLPYFYYPPPYVWPLRAPEKTWDELREIVARK